MRTKWLIRIAVFFALVTLILMWPAGTWLQHREIWLRGPAAPDAVYLVAGARDQDRRVEAVVGYIESVQYPISNIEYPTLNVTDDGGHDTEGGKQRTTDNGQRTIMVLIGNDTSTGRWSGKDQRNPTMAEWAVTRLRKASTRRGREAYLAVVPGKFGGTDEEMKILAGYMEKHSDIRRLAIVTSPFHIRRAVWRLTKHLDRDVTISAIGAEPRLTDRAPWIVLAELAKMLRDCLGLSGAPLLSRKSTQRQ